MSSIRERLTAKGLAHVAERIDPILQPTLYLASEPASEGPYSRLGGQPNLPPRIDWPSWRGRPLPFVAQIDLREMPQLIDLGYPPEGCLFFFYEGGYEAWGFQASDKGAAQVIYEPAGNLQDFPVRNFPRDVADELRFSPARLTPLSVESVFPDSEDQAIESMDLTAEERKAYFDFEMEILEEGDPPSFHRIGGYPNLIQGDPKLEAELVSHGLNCGDATGYEEGRKRGLYPEASQWDLLLQVDSDDAASMLWGDLGRLYFLIRKTDLELRQFDRAWLVFQCS